MIFLDRICAQILIQYQIFHFNPFPRSQLQLLASVCLLVSWKVFAAFTYFSYFFNISTPLPTLYIDTPATPPSLDTNSSRHTPRPQRPTSICLYPSVLLKSHNLQFSYSPSLSYIRCGHILPSQLKSWLNSPTTTSPSKTSL